MTPDARDAFDRAGFSRRDFLKTSGVLVVAFVAAEALPAVAQGPFDTRLSHVTAPIAAGPRMAHRSSASPVGYRRKKCGRRS